MVYALFPAALERRAEGFSLGGACFFNENEDFYQKTRSRQ